MNGTIRKWAALVAVLIGILAVGVAFGEDPGPCHEVYLQSGLTEQQMPFDDFRRSYADTLCAGDGGNVTAYGDQDLGERG